MIETILPIIIGILLLLAGRKVFWFVLAVIGFYVGMKLTPFFVDAPSQSTMLMISLGFGLIAAAIAVVLQKIAIGAVGFVIGGYGAFLAMQRFGFDPGNLNWLVIVGCGILGVVISSMIFEWALIVFSSMVGSYLLVMSLDVKETVQSLVFVLLSVAGVVVQASSKRKKAPAPQAPKEGPPN